MNIKFLGQCGFVFESEKISFAIDPVLNDLVENGQSIRNYPPVFEPEELNVNYVFCTHNHIDHLALETVSKIADKNQNTEFIIPNGCINILKKQGINSERIHGLKAGETLFLEGLKVLGISTAHPVHNVEDNLAYSIVFDGKHIVHLGDTYLTQQLKKDLLNIGKIDYFFPPINGMDEEKAAKGIIGNLNIKEAVELTNILQPEIVIPTHYDMVKGNTANPQEFVDEMKKVNSNQKIKILPLANK